MARASHTSAEADASCNAALSFQSPLASLHHPLERDAVCAEHSGCQGTPREGEESELLQGLR